MDWWLANFFLGAIFSLFLPVVPDLFVLISLLLLSIFFFTFSLNKIVSHSVSLTQPYKPLRLSSGLLFGACWMLFNAFNFQSLWQVNKLNAIELSNKPQWIQGEVLTMHSPDEQIELLKDTDNVNEISDTSNLKRVSSHIRFNILVTQLNNAALKRAINIRLSWKNATLALRQGQKINLKVKFKPTHGLANQGGFNYQTWLNSKMISGTGYVINHKDNRLLSPVNTIRQQLFNEYSTLLINDKATHELAPLLLALGFGSRTALTQNLWQVLQATGTGHLIAISGLHIGLVATGCFYLVMLLLRNLPLNLFFHRPTLQTVNFRYVAIILSMLVAFSYGYLAGFSLPTVRALVMLGFYWLTRLLAIKISIKRWLLLTLLVITLTTPFSLFTASFWLSVYAVIIIFLTLWRFKNLLSTGNAFWRFIKGLVVIQLSLTIMLLPISALFFQKISVVALFANIIAVPWMSFVTIPLCLLSVLMMPISEMASQFLIQMCLASLEIIWHYLAYLSTLPSAVISLSTVGVQVLVFVGLVAALWLFFQPMLTFESKFTFEPKIIFRINFKKHITVLGLILVILMLIFVLTKKLNKQQEHWQLIVFDVGQGLSILVQRDKKAILYDTGASYESGFNMIAAVVLPYLQHAGIKQLDKVIISHSDNDHAGGLAVLQQSIVINELIYNSSHNVENGACLLARKFIFMGRINL